MYDPRGDVGARDTPNIQGQWKETLDKPLTSPLGLGKDLTGERHPALDPLGTSPSVALGVWIYMLLGTSEPISKISLDLQEREVEGRHTTSTMRRPHLL